MKTAYYTSNGPAAEVMILGDKPKPQPKAGEVLVRLHTSGVNPSDVKSRAGRPLNGDYQIPHSDGAGIIEAVGDGVDQARIGERVWIWNGAFQRPDGTAAEYIALPSMQAVQLPDATSFETGACMGIPGLTAFHGVELLKQAGARTVLITGAASSVGYYAVQMAAKAGMRVIGTASAARKFVAEEAGCHHIIDYRQENIAKRMEELTAGEGVDGILDMDFSSTRQLLSTTALKTHGLFACYGSNEMGELAVPFRDLLFRSTTLKFFLVYTLTAFEREQAVNGLTAILEQGWLKTRIAETFTLHQVVLAHEAVESGRLNGNVVINLGR
jgi:NADPH2:quinone reductase